MATKKNLTLLTGATGGIGEPLCFYLAARGHNLLLAARDGKRLNELQDSLSKKFPENTFESVEMDFSDPDSHQQIIDVIGARILTGLVIMPPQIPPTEDCLPEKAIWDEIFNASFVGPLNLIKRCLPKMEPAQRSKVVLISGISSAQVLSHYATSNVLRTMWLAQAKTLSVVYGPKNIHFNTLSLGGVMTEKYKAKLQNKAKSNNRSFDEQMEIEVGNVPLRKYASTEDVAKAVHGLLSEFSDHFTGMNFLCDGGFTRAY